MAKPHKLMWTGIDITTSLEPKRVQAAVAEALVGVKGKFTLVTDNPLLKVYDIKGSETIFATAPELSFDVQISDRATGRRAVRTHITRALLKSGSVPFGPQKMLGHKAYMKFSQALGARVAQADPSARVTLREGAMPEGFALDALAKRVGPPAPAVRQPRVTRSKTAASPRQPDLTGLTGDANGAKDIGEKIRYCTDCGSAVGANAKYCGSCGREVIR